MMEPGQGRGKTEPEQGSNPPAGLGFEAAIPNPKLKPMDRVREVLVRTKRPESVFPRISRIPWFSISPYVQFSVRRQP